jgi:RND family efflux transporter MFP subunit
MSVDDQQRPSRRATKRPGKVRRIALVAIFIAIAVAIAAFGLLQRLGHEAEVTKWTQDQSIPTVAAIMPHSGAAMHRVTLPGTVQAWYEAPIYARVPGYLKKWYFDYGAQVKKGDVLAEIETPDLDAQLSAAEAKLNSARAIVNVRQAEEQFARSTFQRWRDSPKGVVSVQEQEGKEAEFNSAKARLSSANAQVAVDQGEVDRMLALESFKRVTAPFDGVVTARETDIGALINAGSGTGGGNGPELFRVADVHMMRVYVQVPQQLSAGITAGLTAALRLPQYPAKAYKATVATTSNAINADARTLLVELHADNPNGELQPGAYAQVDFEISNGPNIVQVPTSALIFRERGMEVATITANDTVRLTPVTLGRNLGTDVEILQGLTATDRIINSPPDSLSSGDKVRIAAPADGPTDTLKQAQAR